LVAGGEEVTLLKNNFIRCGARAEAELKSCGHHGGLPGGRSRRDHVLVEEVLKLRAAGFIPCGVGVGQIVGDIVDICLLRFHTAGGAVKSSDHSISPRFGLLALTNRLWRPARWR